jgi:rhodanese-related sulfurtransferase
MIGSSTRWARAPLPLLGIVGVFVVACGAPEPLPPPESVAPAVERPVGEAPPREPGYAEITPEEMETVLAAGEHLVMNVHIPYEGEIPGTHLFIPYDEIEAHLDQLPQDRDAGLALYCRSDRMSIIAAEVLIDLGYTNLLVLDGGMLAWEAAGYPLEGLEPLP